MNGPVSMSELLEAAIAGKRVDDLVADVEVAAVDREAIRRADEKRVEDLCARGWPRRGLEIAVAADETRTALAAVAGWDPRRNAMVLSGGKGTGKTVAACWWTLRARRNVTFVGAPALARTSRYDATSFGAFMSASALCLDDLGAEYLDAAGSFLVDVDELVNSFYSARRPLLITTNCTAGEFAARYGGRVMDRLTECAEWVAVGGESMRRRS